MIQYRLNMIELNYSLQWSLEATAAHPDSPLTNYSYVL